MKVLVCDRRTALFPADPAEPVTHVRIVAAQ
jgi:hypothetical protein